MRKLLLSALALIFTGTALPATAGDHAFTLHYNLTKPITNFEAKGG